MNNLQTKKECQLDYWGTLPRRRVIDVPNVRIESWLMNYWGWLYEQHHKRNFHLSTINRDLHSINRLLMSLNRRFSHLSTLMNYSWRLYGDNHKTNFLLSTINRHLHSINRLLMSLNSRFPHFKYTHELFMTTMWTQPQEKFSLVDYKQTLA